jgi:Spy/CpxP family protein refolding chaperone
MKLNLITLSAIGALSIGTAIAQVSPAGPPENRGGGGGRGHRHNSLEQVTENLNLTPEQKAKVQPIIDQAKPQIESIRREAMQKTKAVTDNAMAQIRPMLTPDQQKKLDEAQNSRGGREGRGGRHGRHGQDGQGGQGAQNPPDDTGDQ